VPSGTTTYCRRCRSRKVTGPRGPGTWSTLIPVSGAPRSLNPSSSRVVAFQNAPVPRLLDGFKLLGAPETGINVDHVPGPRGPVTFRDLHLRQYVVVPDGTDPPVI